MSELITAEWPCPSNVHAFTTTVSAGNLGTRTTTGNQFALENRQKLIEHHSIPHDIQWLHQTHTNLAVTLPNTNREPNADAALTQKANTPCAVLTADCLPLLICNQQGSEVAAIHAGWRGLLNGIIDNTLLAMQSDANDMLVWLGPAIGPCHFELGIDVEEQFTHVDPDYQQAFKPGNPGKCYGDLYQLARICLAKYNINKVHGGNLCTIEETNRCYSYRRQGEQSGRMASIIWFE